MNKKISTLTALGVAALFLVVVLPTSQAANHAQFGTQVQFGDSDFIPTLDSVWAAVIDDDNICVLTFGETNVANYGFYLQPDSGTQATLQRFAVRLVEGQGNAAGSEVFTSHTTEQGQTCETGTFTPLVQYGDVNNNNRYDEGDYVWLTTAAAGSLAASSSSTSFTIRLTDTNGGSAGTLVFSQDADYTAYRTDVTDVNTNTRIAYFNADRSTSGANPSYTNGDHLYVAIHESDAADVGDTAPLYSIRLASPSGAFGTQVTFGDQDYIPVLNEVAPATNSFDEVCVVQFGDGTNVADFGFYLNPNGDVVAAGTVQANWIRLKGSGDAEAGTLVSGTDATEIGRDCAGDDVDYRIAFADRNNNGRYDEGDWVFMTTDTTTTNPQLDASSSATSWTLRLTDTDGGNAGTLMFSGDSDFTAYQNSARYYPLTTEVTTPRTLWGVLDRDRSGETADTSLVTSGDSVYLVRNPNTGGTPAMLDEALVPLYSVRVVGESFGTQVTFGDEDFIPTLQAPDSTANVCVVELGDGQNVVNFGFYLVFGTPATVPTNAIRLKEVEGNAAGTVVRDSDTTERGQTCNNAAIGSGNNLVQVHYADLNNNGRYDNGDSLYLVRQGAAADADGLRASTGTAQYTLRLTATGGGAAGTLVFSGDTDFNSYSNAAPELANGGVSLFDQDLSDVTGAAFTGGDTVYIRPQALAGLNLVPLYSIRVTGTLPTGGGGGGTTPTDTTETTSPTESPTDTTETTSPTDTSETTPTTPATTPTTSATTPTTSTTDDDGEEGGAPGLGLIGVLAALGVALVLLRRRE